MSSSRASHLPQPHSDDPLPDHHASSVKRDSRDSQVSAILEACGKLQKAGAKTDIS